MIRRFKTNSAAETRRVGKKIARMLEQGCVIALDGDLGAGKTVLVKGIAEGLGIKSTIQSPTFVVMKVYAVDKPAIRRLVHVDCYRIATSAEVHAIGLEDYLHDPYSVVVIEWPARIRSRALREDIGVRIERLGGNARRIAIDDSIRTGTQRINRSIRTRGRR